MWSKNSSKRHLFSFHLLLTVARAGSSLTGLHYCPAETERASAWTRAAVFSALQKPHHTPSSSKSSTTPERSWFSNRQKPRNLPRVLGTSTMMERKRGERNSQVYTCLEGDAKSKVACSVCACCVCRPS